MRFNNNIKKFSIHHMNNFFVKFIFYIHNSQHSLCNILVYLIVLEQTLQNHGCTSKDTDGKSL
jgi:hypothetical protein